MSKQVVKEGNIFFYFDNLPDDAKLRLFGSKTSLSTIPENFTILNADDYPPLVIEEQPESTSLIV